MVLATGWAAGSDAFTITGVASMELDTDDTFTLAIGITCLMTESLAGGLALTLAAGSLTFFLMMSAGLKGRLAFYCTGAVVLATFALDLAEAILSVLGLYSTT